MLLTLDWETAFLILISILGGGLLCLIIMLLVLMFDALKAKAQRKGVAQGSQDKGYLLILFFPVTVYLFIGTLLLFLLFKFEQVIEVYADYSEWPGIDRYIPTEWHSKNVWLSISFPIVWPILFIWDILVFIYAIFAALVKFLYDTITYIWRQLVKAITAIWKWTIESVLYIWDQIKLYFS
jgi:ABC-type uncharacterized transport system permease subunit